MCKQLKPLHYISIRCLKVMGILIFLNLVAITDGVAETLESQRAKMLKLLKSQLELTDKQVQDVSRILSKSKIAGQGNPKATKHPMTKEQCKEIQKKANLQLPNPEFMKICKSPYMAPIYDTRNQKPSDAQACIDRFEFPNIPCEYPVVWVKANEAAQICEAVGKRLCDAHEWENSCAGQYRAPMTAFPSGITSDRQKVRFQRKQLNAKRQIMWAYGKKQNHALCATGSRKSPNCNKAITGKGGSTWASCGSNTYPVGAFPDCQSKLGVFDQHGNAAEHMNLAVTPRQHTAKGGYGHTEMKGSWFIFGQLSAHKDDCFWRAPYWHGTKVNVNRSHANYHLGFRCCKSI